MKTHHFHIYTLLVVLLIMLTVTVFAATVNSGAGHVANEVWVNYEGDSVTLQQELTRLQGLINTLTQQVFVLNETVSNINVLSDEGPLYTVAVCGTGKGSCDQSACPTGTRYVNHVGETDYDGDGNRYVVLCENNQGTIRYPTGLSQDGR